MLGIDDPYVLAAYLLCIGSTVLCLVYGGLRWNRDDEPVVQEDVRWAAEEKGIDQEL
jgi:hypothetical protein